MDFICRLCLKLISSESLDQDKGFKVHDRDMESGEPIATLIKSVIPEVYLGLSVNPVICLQCHNAVKEAYNFRMKCLRTEKIIGIYVRESPSTSTTVIALRDVVNYWKDLYVNYESEMDVAKANLAEWFGLDNVDFGKRNGRCYKSPAKKLLPDNPGPNDEQKTVVESTTSEAQEFTAYSLNVLNSTTGLVESSHKAVREPKTGLYYCTDCPKPVLQISDNSVKHLEWVTPMGGVSKKDVPRGPLDEPILIIDNSIETKDTIEGLNATANIRKDRSTPTPTTGFSCPPKKRFRGLSPTPLLKIQPLNRSSGRPRKKLRRVGTSLPVSGQVNSLLVRVLNPVVPSTSFVLAPQPAATVPLVVTATHVKTKPPSNPAENRKTLSKPKNKPVRPGTRQLDDRGANRQIVNVKSIKTEPQTSEGKRDQISCGFGDDYLEIKHEPLDPLGVVESNIVENSPVDSENAIGLETSVDINMSSATVGHCIKTGNDDREELHVPQYIAIEDVSSGTENEVGVVKKKRFIVDIKTKRQET